MKHIINIQSFGDLITNSSSEVYCMYTRAGAKQIEDAIKEIARCLNPEIDIDDHLEISCDIDEDWEYYDEESGEILSGKEYYERQFNEFVNDKTNEEVLSNLSTFNNKLLEDLENDYDNKYRALTLVIISKSELGKKLKDAICRILYAFDYEEHYD